MPDEKKDALKRAKETGRGVSVVDVACLMAAAEPPDDRRFPVVLRMVNDAPTRNSTDGYTWKFVCEWDMAQSFRGQFILCAFVDGKIAPYRSAHNGADVRNPITGEAEANFTGADAERIVGYIGDTEDSVWLAEEEGKRWIYAKGYISTRYARPVVDKLLAGTMPVSIEAGVEQEVKDEDEKLLRFKVWRGYGVTLLGDRVSPAVPGARAVAASAEEPDLHEIQAAYERFVAASAEPAPPPTKSPPEEGAGKHDDESPANGGALSYTKKQTGGGKRMPKSKAQLMRELQPMFSEHDVIGFTESGGHVALLSKKDGTVCQYIVNADDEGKFNEKRMSSLPCAVEMPFGEDEAVTVELDEVLTPMAATMRALMASEAAKDELIAAANEKAAAAEKKLSEFEAQRGAERVCAAREAVTAYHEANPDKEKVSSESMTALLAEVDAGKYSAMMDGDKWAGKELALSAYHALYGKGALEAKVLAAKNMQDMDWLKTGYAGKLGIQQPEGETSMIKQVVSTMQ